MNKSAYYNIKKHYEKLSDKEKVIADYFLNHSKIAVSNTITQISNEIDISNATIVRFVRKIGFNSYNAFKISLARESIQDSNHYTLDENDKISTVIANTIMAIEDSKKVFNPESFAKASNLIAQANIIYCFGIGGESVLAFDFYHRFISTGIPCQFNFDFHTQLILASQTTEKDIAVVFNYTGVDKDMLDIIKVLKDTNCPIITITCNKEAPINLYSSVCVYLSPSYIVNQVTHTYTERFPMLLIIDILYLEVITLIEAQSVKAISTVREVEYSRQL